MLSKLVMRQEIILKHVFTLSVLVSLSCETLLGDINVDIRDFTQVLALFQHI